MNLRCQYDQTPFALGREEKISALRNMHAENLHHYDARCPRCGRSTAVSRERLEMTTPGWQEAIKAPAAVAAAPILATPSPVTAAPAKPAKSSRRRHGSSAKKVVAPAAVAETPKALAAKKPAPKAVAAKKPAVKKSVRKK